MSNVLETIKATLQVAFGLVVLVLIIWTFPDIYKAIEKILTTETVSKLKGPGFEVDLNETNVNDALLQQSVATDSQSPVFPAIQKLDSKGVSRLMYVGQYYDNRPPDLCEYKSANSKMDEYYAVDTKLRELSLAKMKESHEIFTRVREKQAKAGKNWEIGDPVWCYEMTLTELGYNVKTALVYNIGKALDKTLKPPAQDLDPAEKERHEPN
jgi:hypothetical protein